MEGEHRGLEHLAQEATPGPWQWYGHTDGEVYLSTVSHGRRFVLTVVDGQPAFQVYDDREGEDPWEWSGRMTPAGEIPSSSFSYKTDMVGVANADARLISLAPTLLSLLLEAMRLMRGPANATQPEDSREWSHPGIRDFLKRLDEMEL